MRNPGLAVVLSLAVPEVGQFYDGRMSAGAPWLVVTPNLWIGCSGLLGRVFQAVSARTAYSYAREHPARP